MCKDFTGCFCFNPTITLAISLFLFASGLFALLRFFIPYQPVLGDAYLWEIIYISFAAFVTVLLFISRMLENRCDFTGFQVPKIPIIIAIIFYIPAFSLIFCALFISKSFDPDDSSETTLESYEFLLDCKGWSHDSNSPYFCTEYATCCIDIVDEIGIKRYWFAFITSTVAFFITSITLIIFSLNYDLCNCWSYLWKFCKQQFSLYNENSPSLPSFYNPQTNYNPTSPDINIATYDGIQSYEQDITKQTLIP